MSQATLNPPEATETLSFDEMVKVKFPDRIGYKTRITPLWNKNGNHYYRVTRNYIENWIECESWWVKVSGGIVTVDKEKAVPKHD